MHKLVLIRHGQSTWNLENRFTGWHDVGLTERGEGEARRAAEKLLEQGFVFDVAYTSLLKRAVKTLWILMEQMNLMWIPVVRDWRLNERHYGALEGLNKAETAAQHGEEQVLIWRRSYDIKPPEIEVTDERFPGRDRRYAELDQALLPRSECLKDTVARVVPYWESTIAPEVKRGKNVVIVAHGNSLRALVKQLDGIADAAILAYNIPTGIPLVYELDNNLKPLRHYYLATDEEVTSALNEVKKQGRASP